MRVLQVSPAVFSGGAERIAFCLFEAYRRMGHESWLAVGWKEGADPDILQIPASRTPWNWFWEAVAWRMPASFPGRKSWKKFLERVAHPGRHLDLYRGREDFRFPGTWKLLDLTPKRPDLLHCHNLHSPLGYFDLRALPHLSAKAPTMLTLHDAWLLAGHCAHSLNCERWLTGCGQCPDLTLHPAVRCDATAFNWTRKRDLFSRSRLYVATPCAWLMKKVEQSILAPAIVESRVIPNGLDLSVFHPADVCEARAELGLPQEAAIVLFAANGIRKNVWKDYDTMRTAMARVASRIKGRELLFLAVGETAAPERMGDALIRFVPYQAVPQTMARYYQAADLYLHGARADTFPTTILEALACGIPVVATGVGGIPEQIQPCFSACGCSAAPVPTGALTPLGDAESMATAIERFLNDAALHRAVAENARRDAEARFDLNLQARHYLDWYQEILAGTWSKTNDATCPASLPMAAMTK